MNRSRLLLITVFAFLFLNVIAYSQQVRDHWKGGDDDVLVVPKGTRIQTDITKPFPDTPATPFEYDGRVEIPVRLGFTTAIPAGSTVKVRIYANYADNGYQHAARLVAVMVNGTEYQVQTDQIPVDISAVKEVTFTLLNDLKISR